ncbi:unnamed protein product, partial [Ixodes hexagonus]
MDAGSVGSSSATPSPPTLTFGSPLPAHSSPDHISRASPKSGLGSLTPTRSTPESPLGAALPPPPPPHHPKHFGVPGLHGLNGRSLYGSMRPPPSPPGIPSDASATDCRLIDYRGAKVAAFYVGGEYLLCLPQAFELFLKHLVGGLHTVYTKLKRLDITPIVCNVEQVRILRGLGAIQPGVNRCKLLSCKDFDSLYKDCTTARSASRLWNAASLMGAGSSPANASAADRQLPDNCSFGEATRVYLSFQTRQARPPKRSSLMSLSPSNGSPLGMMSKKGRIDDYPGYENGHLAAEHADKPHGSALLPNGFSPQQAAAAAAAHLNATLPFLALGAHHPGAHPGSLLGAAMGLPLPGTTPHHALSSPASRGAGELGKATAAPQMDPQAALRLRDDGGSVRDRMFSSYDGSRLKDSAAYINGGLSSSASNGHGPPVLNLSQHAHRTDEPREYQDGAAQDADDDTEDDTDDRDQELDTSAKACMSGKKNVRNMPRVGLPFAAACYDCNCTSSSRRNALDRFSSCGYQVCSAVLSSCSLTMFLFLLISAELKMEVLRERGLRENLEKQLSEEQRTRVLYQKRLKKERRCRRRIQDQLELEQKKRSQYEEVLRTTATLPPSEHRSPPAQHQQQQQPQQQ